MSRLKVKGQRSRSPGTKNETAESSPLTMHSRACAVGPYAASSNTATDDTIAWSPRGDGLRRWENQRMLSSFAKVSFMRFRIFCF